MQEIELIPADASFAAVYALMHQMCFKKSWNEATMRQLLLMPGAFGFIAQKKTTPVGFIVCSSAADEAEIMSIAVLQEARGDGVGDALIRQAFSYAQQRKISAFFLEVADENDHARRLYERNGFKAVGCRKGYYDLGEDKADALVMRADL